MELKLSKEKNTQEENWSRGQQIFMCACVTKRGYNYTSKMSKRRSPINPGSSKYLVNVARSSCSAGMVKYTALLHSLQLMGGIGQSAQCNSPVPLRPVIYSYVTLQLNQLISLMKSYCVKFCCNDYNLAIARKFSCTQEIEVKTML